MGYYSGYIKVVCGDMMCFPVNQNTLDAISCGCYDPYAWTDPDRDAIETITFDEWIRRVNIKWNRKSVNYYRGNK